MRRAALLLAALAGCAPETPERVESAPLEASAAEAAPAVGTVCPDPAHPCPGFREHDLSFVLPDDGLARAEARSDTFFAVILRSGPRCSIGEEERASVQADFPGRKVFAERAECDGDVENNVRYAGASDSVSFLAVYAGPDRRAADSTLAVAGAADRFPGANLRRLQAVFMYP